MGQKIKLACKCKWECQQIDFVHRQHFFDAFYKTDRFTQNNYLLGLIQIIPIKRRRVNKSESRKVCYTLPDGKGNHKQICRKTFEDTFSLSHKKVQHLTELKKEGKNTYTDNPGNNKSARKYSDVDVTSVVNHINSFPKSESHYRASNASEVGSLKNNLDLHHRKAEKATNTMKDDIKNSQEPTSQHCTIAVDLQQVIFIPSLTHGDMFYLRQLSVFNLGIHIGDTNQAFMCLWHEGTTGRGGNEIASCVLKVLRANATNKNILNLWTDNSSMKEGTLDEIHHKYLVKGHSYLPCDRDFALIEKRKRVTKTIVDKMITSTRHNNQFKVVRMNNEDFFDFKTASDTYLNTTKLNITKASGLKFKKIIRHKCHLKKVLVT
ncbi:hypothetical protein NQ314_003997 [Rhamnusium bicolor]|uniref:Uncharacterized protein n=1 Tax=Rhamnusium bicolor TaxID=1586634 RepID=A0AAV8ZNV9_9CUCU|nr:hypothetical protein NQ314_003997 [Rhamnusium bicolor]